MHQGAVFVLFFVGLFGCGAPTRSEQPKGDQDAKAVATGSGRAVVENPRLRQQDASQPDPQQHAAGEPNAARVATSTGDLPDLRTRRTGSDWPNFLGPNRDSKSTETGILTDWSRTAPPLRWHQPVATGYGMPTISKGRLFQFERSGDQAVLRVMRSETGEPIWKFSYPADYEDQYGYDNGPRCSAVIDEDRVYLFGAGGMLHCLAAADGSVLWKVDTHKDFGVIQNFFGVGSTPIVEGDRLIVQVGGSPPGSDRIPVDRLEGNGSGIVAFDKFTGQVVYKISNELASYASPVVATIAGRRFGFAFLRGGLLAFEPTSGQIDFHYPWRATVIESVNASTPLVVGSRVFISECYGPGSSLFDVRSGAYDVVWSDDPRRRQKSLQTHWNTPIHHEGFVYGSSGRHSNQAELRCIELATGEVRWSQSGLSRSSLLYVDGHFVCLTEYGDLLLLRATPDAFEQVAQLKLTDPTAGPQPAGLSAPGLLSYPAWAAPILSHGLLYLRGRGRLVCLELIPEQGR